MKRNIKSDKNLIKRTAFETADAIASNITGLNIAWALVKSLSGNALELRQKRVLEFVEAIQNDPSTFNKSVVSSDEFQDGLVQAEKELERLNQALPTEQQFVELIRSYLETVLKTNDLVEEDSVYREVVLNLRVKDDVVSVIKLNPPYDLMVDLSKVPSGREEVTYLKLFW